MSGVTISSTPDADYALGFFGIVDGGTVQNLNLKGVSLTAANSELAGAASMAACAKARGIPRKDRIV